MEFAIMHFINDNSVATVPLKWILNVSLCYWPPYRGSRLENAIQKKEEPKTSWEKLPARTLHLYASHESARQNLKQAELDTSALDTDHNEQIYLSKKRRKNFSSSDEEHNEDNDAVLICPTVPPGLTNSLVKSIIKPNKLTFHPRLRNTKITAKPLQTIVSNTTLGENETMNLSDNSVIAAPNLKQLQLNISDEENLEDFTIHTCPVILPETSKPNNQPQPNYNSSPSSSTMFFIAHHK